MPGPSGGLILSACWGQISRQQSVRNLRGKFFGTVSRPRSWLLLGGIEELLVCCGARVRVCVVLRSFATDQEGRREGGRSIVLRERGAELRDVSVNQVRAACRCEVNE